MPPAEEEEAGPLAISSPERTGEEIEQRGLSLSPRSSLASLTQGTQKVLLTSVYAVPYSRSNSHAHFKWPSLFRDRGGKSVC